MQDLLDNNDNEFINEIHPNLNNQQNINKDKPPNHYNKNEFNTEMIINILQSYNILKPNPFCDICGNIMKLSYSSNYIDGIYWRCRNKTPTIHDIKINIRINSVYENLRIPIKILYFITFFFLLKIIVYQKLLWKLKLFVLK